MVEKTLNAKEVSSEYQKIKNRLSDIDNKGNRIFSATIAYIDNKINRVFNTTIHLIFLSSLCTVSLITPPILFAIDSLNGLGVFTLNQVFLITGVTVFVIMLTMLIASINLLIKLKKEPSQTLIKI